MGYDARKTGLFARQSNPFRLAGVPAEFARVLWQELPDLARIWDAGFMARDFDERRRATMLFSALLFAELEPAGKENCLT